MENISTTANSGHIDNGSSDGHFTDITEASPIVAANEQLPDGSLSILEDITSGLVQQRIDASGTYGPRLIANRPGSTMGEAISEELANSNHFDISVAFVSSEAIKTLFEDFRSQSLLHPCQSDSASPDADTKLSILTSHTGSHPSRLITSTKNFFNTPATFWELLRLKDVAHVDVRIWEESAHETVSQSKAAQGQPFHPKGYIFSRHMENGSHYYNLYVGSSNLTGYALNRQREWNLRISSLESGELVSQFREELDSQVANSKPLTEDWIRQYEEDFKKYAPPRKAILREIKSQEIVPNQMQQEALMNLASLRSKGEHRAIIISATGTGKTYLSAFDVRQFKPKRMLYIAQQQQILTKAMESYQTVLGCGSDQLGLFSGTSKQSDRRYVFATIQTLSQPEVLNSFKPDEFDYILVDEVHHSGAASYQRVIDHFKDAKFMLGMTATPERTDGINIFGLFGHNIAYEIRLQKALEADMLCPFHYYGVTEYLGSSDADSSDQSLINISQDMSARDSSQLKYEIQQLATRERVRYIIDKLQQYSPYHQQITGLVFCSTREEARELSRLFNEQVNQQAENRKYRTEAVTGDTPIKDRADAIDRLEQGELDYIFTVDLFNEGIDIPAVNQIIMLRSTQSSIIFTQQLGRGLRKFPHKESVIVIDFIGNYSSNYLIPIALYGNTGDRDIARKNLQRRSIGLSSISFDEIAKDRVLKSLDQADWSEMKKLSEQYRQLRFQLGRIPMLTDVYAHDPSLPVTFASKKGEYLSFVSSRERSLGSGKSSEDENFFDQLEPVTGTETGILKMATELLLPGLRPHELVALDMLCNFAEENIADTSATSWTPSTPVFVETLKQEISLRFPDAFLAQNQIESALHVLDFSYFMAADHTRFGATPLIEVINESGERRIRLSKDFASILMNNRTFRIFFADTLRCGLRYCRDLFKRSQEQQRKLDRGFLYEQKYSLFDVERLLGWQREVNGSSVGGYFCHRETGTMPFFVKYATSQYEDRFLGPQDMFYFSKNGRTPDSPEFIWMKNGLGSEDWADNHFIPLFVMRKEESKEARYYYVGHVASFNDLTLTTKMDADGTRTVNVTTTTLRLAKPLDTELYRHLTGLSTS